MTKYNPPPVRSNKTPGQLLDQTVARLQALTSHVMSCDGCTRGHGIAPTGVGCRTANRLQHELCLSWLALRQAFPAIAGTQMALDFTAG